MADFNFTVQDLMSTDPSPFLRENTKDLPTGKPLNTSGSYAQTGVFQPTVGMSVLSVGEMMMGPTVFTSNTTALTSDVSTLQSLASTQDTPTVATATGGSSTSPGTAGGGTSSSLPATANAAAKITVVVQAAQAELHVPYQWGGGTDAGPTLGSNDGHGQIIGFDCSGLVLFCFNKAGLTLPHNAQEQYNDTNPLPNTNNCIAGDLVFFGTSTTTIEHVGIVVSPGQMIDAPDSGSFVRQENYNWSDLIAASRPFVQTDIGRGES